MNNLDTKNLNSDDSFKKKMNWEYIFRVRVLAIFVALGLIFPIAISTKDSSPSWFWVFLGIGAGLLVLGFFGKMWLRRHF